MTTSQTSDVVVVGVTLQPYMAKTYFGLRSPPANLAKIVISSGAMGSELQYADIPVVNVVYFVTLFILALELTMKPT
jgi:hypothetical protein